MKAFVYILYSRQLERFYTGMSTVPNIRLKQHLKGKSHWSSRASDWERIFLKECADVETALTLEKKIKSQGAQRFLGRANG